MTTLITHATLLNEGERFNGSLLIEGERIAALFHEGDALPQADRIVEAHGDLLLPGVIDDHVHFREPGLTDKGDIASESRAALAGGVTSVMDMPNVIPQTTTNERWRKRQALGEQESRVNYAYYLGATNDNLEEILQADLQHVPAVKLFMGSSTGNMLVDREEALRLLFRHSPLPIMTHCEDTRRITRRMTEARAQWGDDPAPEHHPWIRDEEACLQSSLLAARLAREENARLHLAHLTTAEELDLLGDCVTGEICIPHLLFTDADYARFGARIKCNPAVKGQRHREALRQALNDGRITLVATDHAPHRLEEKEGGARLAASGMPMVQFSLLAMLGLASEGVLKEERVVQLMCHGPASLFGIEGRGFLRVGYQADLVLVKPSPWTLRSEDVLSRCGWSPLEGHTFTHRVTHTFVNGHLAYHQGQIDETHRGQALRFLRT